VLEKGLAAYPYSGQLTARLAQQYAMDWQAFRARKLIEKYRAVFPEDPAVRDVEKHLATAGNVDPSSLPSGTVPPPISK